MCSIMGYCSDSADKKAFEEGFDRTISRGPDDTRIVDTGHGLLDSSAFPSWALQKRECSPFPCTGIPWSATGNCTASAR